MQPKTCVGLRDVSVSIVTVFILTKGGAVASWLVRSTPDRAVRVRDLAGDIVLCSWARHSTLTVPLSTQVYKWVPENGWEKTNKLRWNDLRWTSIPSRRSRTTPSRFMLQKSGIVSGSYDPVGSKASFSKVQWTRERRGRIFERFKEREYFFVARWLYPIQSIRFDDCFCRFSTTSNIHNAPHAQLQRAFYNKLSFHRPHRYSRHYSAWYCVKWRKFMSIIVRIEKVMNNQSGWPLALVTQTEEGEEVKGLSLRRRESLPFVRLLRRSLLPRPRPHCAR